MKSNKELWSSKLLGRYHFEGPVKLRSLNVYKDKPFSIDIALSKFGKTLAAKMRGKEYICSWIYLTRSEHMHSFIVEIIRKDPKIPSRCRYPMDYLLEITFEPA